MFLQILGVIAVSVSVIPWILIPVLPLLLFFLFLRRFFLRTSRNIKRLESTSECCASDTAAGLTVLAMVLRVSPSAALDSLEPLSD